MTREELSWSSACGAAPGGKYFCFRVSDGKILGEVEKGQSYWAGVQGANLGNYIDLQFAKLAVERKLTGETK
jgi:hypothetical protein